MVGARVRARSTQQPGPSAPDEDQLSADSGCRRRDLGPAYDDPKNGVELGDRSQLFDRRIAADSEEQPSFALHGRRVRRTSPAQQVCPDDRRPLGWRHLHEPDGAPLATTDHDLSLGRPDIANPLRLAGECDQVLIAVVTCLPRALRRITPERRPGTSSTTTCFGPIPRLIKNGPSRLCTRW